MKIEELYAKSETISDKKGLSSEKVNSNQTKEKNDPEFSKKRFSISQGSKTPRTPLDSKNNKRKVLTSGKSNTEN